MNDSIKNFKITETLYENLNELCSINNEYTQYNVVHIVQLIQGINENIDYSKLILEHLIRIKIDVSEEKLLEFCLILKHFEEQRVSKLDHQKFIFCLRAFCYDIPIIKKGERNVIVERILDKVDLNRTGKVNLHVCIHFINSYETNYFSCNSDLINSFKILTIHRENYVTEDEQKDVSERVIFL